MDRLRRVSMRVQAGCKMPVTTGYTTPGYWWMANSPAFTYVVDAQANSPSGGLMLIPNGGSTKHTCSRLKSWLVMIVLCGRRPHNTTITNQYDRQRRIYTH